MCLGYYNTTTVCRWRCVNNFIYYYYTTVYDENWFFDQQTIIIGYTLT